MVMSKGTSVLLPLATIPYVNQDIQETFPLQEQENMTGKAIFPRRMYPKFIILNQAILSPAIIKLPQIIIPTKLTVNLPLAIEQNALLN
jgi:uncharacterized membrane protein YdbT with pleckstrin-like domain